MLSKNSTPPGGGNVLTESRVKRSAKAISSEEKPRAEVSKKTHFGERICITCKQQFKGESARGKKMPSMC